MPSPTFSGEQKELARVQLRSLCCQTVIGSLIFGLVGRDSWINFSVSSHVAPSCFQILSVAILARYIGSSSNKKLLSHPPCWSLIDGVEILCVNCSWFLCCFAVASFLIGSTNRSSNTFGRDVRSTLLIRRLINHTLIKHDPLEMWRTWSRYEQ